MDQLRSLGTEQTRNTYLRHGLGPNVFGVSYAHLGQLKKAFVGRGKDKDLAHQVALALWQSGNFEARTLATMIADPKQFSPAEAEAWVADVRNHALADTLAGLVAATPFAEQKAGEWTSQSAEFVQRTGYALLAKQAQQSALSDACLEAYISQIENHIPKAANRAKEGMNNALIAIGCRSETLRHMVEAAADRLGPVVIDHGDTACQTFVIRPYLEKVWARKASKI
ncbi:hypothetical protein ASU33_11550 [Solirubrum puertoriconensis]|uniref:DNA alkylation repair enzyme n=1 Tax=Solirubrum puertoriconensis TaxID=1751427 RepID=A0A9X0L5M2_SOLP1|nr:hypothetical protein ASU33_11550 [Solirubrum puertoriconensis]